MKNKFVILSIDGGGVRGIIPAVVLTRLESRLRELSGNPNLLLTDCIDLVAGTSTGAILSTMMLLPDDQGKPEYSLRSTVSLYRQYAKEIFTRSAFPFSPTLYNEKPMINLFQKLLGNMRLSDLILPVIMPAFDIQKRSSFFFASHTAKTDPDRNFLLRDLLPACVSVPAYFKPSIYDTLNFPEKIK
jgi:patatin-like phospholipase/acyl hydrolase